MTGAPAPPLPVVTLQEVARHNTAADCWVAIGGFVYNVTEFLEIHPGGRGVLLPHAGQDATKAFFALHRTDALKQHAARLLVGRLPEAVGDRPDFGVPGSISRVPHAEPSAWQGLRSPFYSPQHLRFRSAVRAFVDRELAPHAAMYETTGKDPAAELFLKLGQAGILACRLGPAFRPFLGQFELPGGVAAEDFDHFHEQIAHEEIGRLEGPGYKDGLGGGLVIGLPPVRLFGSPALQAQVIPPVMRGEKRIALAISEPGAGSDVANLQTTARRSPCGRFYVVSGVKKWITNGTAADYFATAVRTGGPGVGGISLLLVERGPGLSTRKIRTAYSGAAGTAYVELEDVKVPVEHLLGRENEGFKCIMANFNHERWLIIAGVMGAMRVVVEECLKWAHQREVFGERLIDKPVIRQKLGAMVAQLEGVQNWLDLVTYQLDRLSHEEQNRLLAGPLALLKYQCTRVADFIGGEACQIFGGRALTATGMGRVVTQFRTAQKFAAILGGSEEIMCDLGVRQAMRAMPPDARL